MPFELTWTNKKAEKKSCVYFFLWLIYFYVQKREEESNQSRGVVNVIGKLVLLLWIWFWLSLTVTTLFIGMAWHGTARRGMDGLAFHCVLCRFFVWHSALTGTMTTKEKKKCM